MLACTFPRKKNKIGPMILNEEITSGEIGEELVKRLVDAAGKVDGIIFDWEKGEKHVQETA